MQCLFKNMKNAHIFEKAFFLFVFFAVVKDFDLCV